MTGRHLIYTNVEAADSPTGTRGAQVWRWWAGINPEQKREVVRRVDDFRLPPGVKATDPFYRYAFFCTSGPDSLAVVARSNALPETDKFGRTGRFFAHAVAVPADDLEAWGGDPFRLLDSISFFSHPDQVRSLQHAKGVLDSQEITPVVLRSVAPVPPDVLAAVAGHLDREAPKTLVLTGPPDGVLNAIRALIQGLPAQLRMRFWFDSQSTGSSLGQVPCAAAGAATPGAERGWAYRKFVPVDWQNGWACPRGVVLDKPAREVPSCLLRADGWAELTDQDRAAVWSAATAVVAGEAPTESLSEAAVRVLDCEAVRAQLRMSAALKVEKELTPLLRSEAVDLAVANYVDARPLRLALERLGEPLPRGIIASELVKRFDSFDAEPDAQTIAALDAWNAAGRADPHLQLIIARWRGTESDLQLLRAEREGPHGIWLQSLVRETLPEGWDGPAQAATALGYDGQVPPAVLRDARLLAATTDETEELTGLMLRIAYHTPGSALEELISGRGALAVPPAELLAVTTHIIRPRTSVGWGMIEPNVYFLGLFIYPDDARQSALLRAVEIMGSRRHDLSLYRTIYPRAFPPPPTELQKRPEPATVLSSEAMKIIQPLLNGKGSTATASAALRESGNAVFLEVADYLFSSITGEPYLEVPQLDADDASLVGFRIGWIQNDDQKHRQVFEAVLEAVAPCIDRYQAPPQMLQPLPARRFCWLSARLLGIDYRRLAL